jgi:3-isopropylmalate/(R)-2-methylmalate dehydratase small subunit
VVEQLMVLVERDPAAQVTVDLERREVRAAGVVAAFELDDFTRWRLMEGLDDIGLTLRHDADIAGFEATRPSWKPVAQQV